jgi:mono/diheme cytochrome c family protein
MSRFVLIAAVAGPFFLALPAWAQTPAERGLQVYGAQKCSMCHAVAGKGNAKGPLDGVGMKLSPADLREWIVNAKEMAEKHKAIRKPPMRDFSALPAADVDALVAYLQTLR